MSAEPNDLITTRPVSQSVAAAAEELLASGALPTIQPMMVSIPEVVDAPEVPSAAATGPTNAELAAASGGSDRSASASLSYSGAAASAAVSAATNSESAAASAASSPAVSRRATSTSVGASDSDVASPTATASASQLAPIPDAEQPATTAAAAPATGDGSAPPPMPRLPTLLAVEVTVAQQRSTPGGTATSSLTAPLNAVADAPAPAFGTAAEAGAPEQETMADGKFKTLNRPLRANAANNSTSNGETKAGDTVLITPPAVVYTVAAPPAQPTPAPTPAPAGTAPAPVPAPAAGRAALASLIANKSAPPSIPTRPGAGASAGAPAVKPPKPANPPPPLSTVTSNGGGEPSGVASPSNAIVHPALPPTPGGAAAVPEDKAAKNARLRVKVLDEILDTERAYVANLQALSDHMIGPITSRSVDSDMRLLSTKEIAEMFSNITHILQLNTYVRAL